MDLRNIRPQTATELALMQIAQELERENDELRRKHGLWRRGLDPSDEVPVTMQLDTPETPELYRLADAGLEHIAPQGGYQLRLRGRVHDKGSIMLSHYVSDLSLYRTFDVVRTLEAMHEQIVNHLADLVVKDVA